MIKTIIGAMLGVALGASAAVAQCTVPNTLTNGNNADATQVMANFAAVLACINGLPPPTPAATSSSVRQTVSAGPVTSAGLPNFLPATSGSLSLTTQNVSGAAPLAITAANNVDATTGGDKDLVGKATSNLTWSGLTASTTNYLYVTVAANGTLTTGKTTVAPIYQWGGTPAATNGLFTFNIGEMKGYLGTGSTASQAYIVFIGEAVTSASGVTSTVAYAYNGRYESAYTNTLPAGPSATTASHNIGDMPRIADFRIRCITAESGYAVGDELGMGTLYTNDGSVNVNPAVVTTQKTITFTVQQNYAYNTKTSPFTRTSPTRANWQYKFVAQRGW